MGDEGLGWYFERLWISPMELLENAVAHGVAHATIARNIVVPSPEAWFSEQDALATTLSTKQDSLIQLERPVLCLSVDYHTSLISRTTTTAHSCENISISLGTRPSNS